MTDSTLTAFFLVSNLLLTPQYVLMILAPRWGITQRFMRKMWFIVPLIVLYVTFATLIVISTPEIMLFWRELYAEGGILGASGDMMGRAFAQYPQAALLHGWIHVVIGDLLMARHVFFDTQKRGWPAWITSLLVLMIGMVGPIGFAVYLIVRALRREVGEHDG
jgi:hypothetical protein